MESMIEGLDLEAACAEDERTSSAEESASD